MNQRFNLTALALSQQQLAWFFVTLIAVSGILAFFELGQREDPDFTFRAMVIRTQWVGATPQQVDQHITERIVKKLQELPHFKVATSYSRVGESLILLELHDLATREEVPQLWYQVRKKVDDIAHTLPPGIIGPSFNDEFGDVYGSIYAVTGDGFSLEELRQYTEQVRQRLLRLPDVAKIELIGIRPEQITLTISQERLASLGISPLTLAQVLREQNIVQDAGQLQTGDYAIPLRVSGNFDNLDQLAAMPLRIAGQHLKLSDVVQIERGYVDPPEMTMRYGGKEAIGLAISMKGRGDVLRLGEDLNREMAALQHELPAGVSYSRVSDQPAVVKNAVGEFMMAFLEAVAIVLAMSFLILGLRAGLVVAITIPVVLAATFLLMRQLGIDLHRISTGALIIALGLLVDDAMIVIEMMVRKLEEGYDRFKAATFAYTATAFPMLTGTLITVAGFLPIGTAKSTTGEYTFAMFTVISLALLVSWVIAVFVTPLAGFHLLKAHPGKGHDVFDTPFYHRLRRVLDWCLGHRKTVIAATVGVFTLGVIGMGMTEKQFFPSSNRTEIMVELWLPEGSSLEHTERLTTQLERHLAGNKDISSYVSYVGNSSPRFFLSLMQQLFRPNYAQVVVLTPDIAARERVMAFLNQVVAKEFYHIRTRVIRVPLGPPVEYPVEFRLLGPDPKELKRLAEPVLQQMRHDQRLLGVHTSWGDLSPMVRVDIDQERARAAGISSETIARALQGWSAGSIIGQYREGDQLINIVLRTAKHQASQIDQVSSIPVPTQDGRSLPLSQVAVISLNLEEPIYWRRSREMLMNIRADVVDGVQPPDITMELDAQFNQLRANLPPGYRLEIGGTLGESAGAQDSIKAGFPLMIMVILALLMLQLRSISHTLMVLVTAPLGIIGVAMALLVFQQPFGFVAMLGTIALAGMIMRNTVILVDQIRQDLESGLTPWDAIRESTLRRFRPIVLTAAAAIVAMIPLTSSVLWGPMAYAIMGGLFVATALTILFVPTLYATWFRVSRPV